jgi:hypothetical protein
LLKKDSSNYFYAAESSEKMFSILNCVFSLEKLFAQYLLQIYQI